MKRASKIVVDSLAQCRHIGELQHAFTQGLVDEESVHAEIGEILIGNKTGRESADEITLFDSTGLSAQDIAAANVVFKVAQEKGLGLRLPQKDAMLKAPHHEPKHQISGVWGSSLKTEIV